MEIIPSPKGTIENSLELENFREEFRKLKEENLNKKERSEGYDFHFDFIDLEGLKEGELLLWERLKKPNTKEDIITLEKDINIYEKRKTIEAVNRLATQNLQGENFDQVLWSDPGVNLAGFFKNTLAKKILKEQLKIKVDSQQ